MHWSLWLILGLFAYFNTGYFLTWATLTAIRKYGTVNGNTLELKLNILTFILFPITFIGEIVDNTISKTGTIILRKNDEIPFSYKNIISGNDNSAYVVITTIGWPLFKIFSPLAIMTFALIILIGIIFARVA